MAIAAVKSLDTTRYSVIRATGVASETDGTFVDVSSLKKYELSSGRVSLTKLHWSIQGAGVLTLEWDATSDVMIGKYGGNGSVDYPSQGGGAIYSTSAAGTTGDINVTTDGNVTGYTLMAEVAKVSGFEAPASNTETAPADATYTTGQFVDYLVKFDEDVVVTGVPYLTYTMDACDAADRLSSTTCKGIYTSGNNTNTLLFRRTTLGDDAENGSTAFFAVGALIVLNSGTIKSSITGKAVDLNITGLTDDGGIIIT